MPCLQRFPFPAEFVSEELLQRRREVEGKVKEQNANKFDWDTVIKYNMQVLNIFAAIYSFLTLGLSVLAFSVRCYLEMQIQVEI